MQLRLGRVGMRPISALVDLTNYVMADLGQPMHAFDGAHVPRIEVAWADEGEVFRTLDGMDRKLPPRTLMIKAEGKSIALAGIMGGLETEISKDTTSLLLESANFDAATIRRSAVALGLRTDASARFEKSLDPVNTVLSIQRFLHLAKESYPDLRLTSPLSDCYPSPFPEVSVQRRAPPGGAHHRPRRVGRRGATPAHAAGLHGESHGIRARGRGALPSAPRETYRSRRTWSRRSPAAAATTTSRGNAAGHHAQV